MAALSGAVLFASTVTYSYRFSRDLVTGMSGPDVAELQSALEDLGFLSGSTRFVRGRFGPSTRAAVARFQRSAGIAPADGRAGPATRAHLETRNIAGPSRVLDFRVLCGRGRLTFSGLFGSTVIEIDGPHAGKCRLRYGAESEHPGWDGKLHHSCAVPLRSWVFQLSDGTGIDLSPLGEFCELRP